MPFAKDEVISFPFEGKIVLARVERPLISIETSHVALKDIRVLHMQITDKDFSFGFAPHPAWKTLELAWKTVTLIGLQEELLAAYMTQVTGIVTKKPQSLILP